MLQKLRTAWKRWRENRREYQIERALAHGHGGVVENMHAMSPSEGLDRPLSGGEKRLSGSDVLH
jgi:hypothetical protein